MTVSRRRLARAGWAGPGFALFTVVTAFLPTRLTAQDHTTRIERNVVYGMVSGAALLMDVHHPAEPNGTGIVWIRGSGWGAPAPYTIWHLKKEEYVSQLLRDAGYTVFAINHRGAPLFRYPAAVLDAQRAVRFIRNSADRYGIDPDRIGGLGGSSGGHLIGMLATLDGQGRPGHEDPVERESSKLQAAVLAAAPANLAEFDAGGAANVVRFMGDTPGSGCRTASDVASSAWCAPAYFDGSPVRHVTPDDPPILLIHGDQDRSVPYEQAEQMFAALEQAGVEAKLVRIAGGGHTNPGRPGEGEALRWLNRHLLGPVEAAALEPLIEAAERLDAGRLFALEGRIAEALAAYRQAAALDRRLTVTAGDWNHLCWRGGLWEHAEQVIDACDRAVELDPDNIEFRDSRGLVRSLLGNRDGAIADFEFFIERIQNPDRKAQRQGWVDALRAGRNPFTPELLRSVR